MLIDISVFREIELFGAAFDHVAAPVAAAREVAAAVSAPGPGGRLIGAFGERCAGCAAASDGGG